MIQNIISCVELRYGDVPQLFRNSSASLSQAPSQQRKRRSAGAARLRHGTPSLSQMCGKSFASPELVR